MANTTITDLPNATTPLGPEYIVLDQGGETKRLQLSDLFLNSGSETITSLTQNGNVLSYTNEAGVVNTIDAETVTSLSLLNGVLSYTDEVEQTTNLTLIPDGSIGYAKLSLGAPVWDETGSVNAGGITISGHLSPTLSDADIGREVPRVSFANDATNLWLKGNSAGVSGIFFESDEDGSDINRESDGAYIQYHARGINNSPYSNTEERGDLIIGIANDDSEGGTIGAEDKIIFNIPGRNQLVTTYDAGVTEHKIWHAGNDGVDSGLDADLLDGKDGSLYVTRDTDVIDDDTMATATDTTLATSESIKAYVDASTQSFTPSTLTPSTYAGEESVTLPNGLIMKFGKATGTSGDVTIAYGTPFPNAVLSIILTNIDSGNAESAGTANYHVKTGYTTSQFECYINSLADGGTFWQAIGY